MPRHGRLFRGVLLLHVLAHDGDGSAAAGGGEVARGDRQQQEPADANLEAPRASSAVGIPSILAQAAA
jgi:hypothetical protein